MFRKRSESRRLIRVLAGVELLEQRQLLADVTWSNGTGDNLWGTAGNWAPAGIPAPLDTAIFSGGADLARLDANHRVKELHATGGAATVDVKNRTLHVEGKLIVRGSSLSLENSGPNAGAGRVTGPVLPDPDGVLVEFAVPEVLIEGNGVLITSGTPVERKTHLFASALTVGDEGSGTLEVRKESGVVSESAVVGKNSDGAVNVGDDGGILEGIWENKNHVIIGDAGEGALVVRKAGTVLIGKSLTVGAKAGSSGAVTVRDHLRTSEQAIISDSGAGLLDVLS